MTFDYQFCLNDRLSSLWGDNLTKDEEEGSGEEEGEAEEEEDQKKITLPTETYQGVSYTSSVWINGGGTCYT